MPRSFATGSATGSPKAKAICSRVNWFVSGNHKKEASAEKMLVLMKTNCRAS